jgi:hypothetical protein
MKIRPLIMTVALSTLVASSAFAQATRTWVSGVGDDVNPCSRTAPCKTFAGAISKTAAGGEISVLDPGGFGAVTITKSITIDGGGIVGSILSAITNGVNVNAGANDVVTLRNLSINGATTGLTGVNIVSGGAKAVILEHVKLLGMAKCVNDTHTAAVQTQIFMDDVSASNCSTNGFFFQPGAGASSIVFIKNSSVTRVGTTVSHDGIASFAGVAMHLDNVTVFAAAGAGLHPDAGSLVTVDNSFFVRNGGDGIQVGPGAAVLRLQGSTTAQNSGAGVRSSGGQIHSYKNNRSSDNGLADSVPTQANFY